MLTKIKHAVAPYKKRLIIVLVIVAVLFVWHPFANESVSQTVESVVSQKSRSERDLANVSTENLSENRKLIFTLIKQEYDKDPKYFDETVMKYTEGNRESWCADYISWIYLKAGEALINPNSGYWRIPGVLTLQKYFIDNNAYASVDSDYTPKLGDVAFYIGSQTPDNTSDEHAAFVIQVKGDTITTIGGNEGTGVMRLRTETIEQNKAKGMVGYGQVELE